MEPAVRGCSVIIPTFNRASRIGRCVESALQSEIRDVEVIVVDDGSTDRTDAIVERFGAQVKYLRQDNAGPAAARNTGIRAGTRGYVAFLDSDDVMLPGPHQRIIDYLETHPDVSAGFGDVFVNNAAGEIERAYQRSYMTKFWDLPASHDGPFRVFDRAGFGRLMLLDRCLVSMGAIVVRRSALEAAGRFDTFFFGYEEWDLFIRLANRYSFAYLDEPMARIEKHDSNFSADREQMVTQAIAILDKSVQSDLPLSPEVRRLAAERLRTCTFEWAYHAFVRDDLPTTRRRLRMYASRWGWDRRALKYWLLTWLGTSALRYARGWKALASNQQGSTSVR